MKMTSRRMRQGEKFVLSAIAAVVASSFSSGAAFAQEAAATDATKLDTIEVTGSRIRRADTEGALPVSTITREQIELSGNVTVGDILRNTSFNTFGSFRQQSGSSAQALVSVDLRGLGSERTLVLIDGRRAPKAPFSPGAQDLNAVPLAAVERIEILSDGASAIYGSDAIGGVINIILRKDYEGVEMSYQRTGTERKGGDLETASMVFGVNGQKGNIVAGVYFQNRDIIFARDSLYNTQGSSFFSNNRIGFDTGTISAVPGGCPNSDPGFRLLANGRCGYDFNLVAADEAETQSQSLFAKGRYEITEGWDFLTAASISRAKSFGRYAPALNDIPLIVSADNPRNNTGEAYYLYHRFAGLGTRDTGTDANVYDITMRTEGHIGPVTLNVGGRYNEYKYFELGRNFLALPVAQGLIDDGSYNWLDPINNDPEVLNALKATTSRESTWAEEQLFADATMGLFSLPGGESQLAVGFEYRTEDYSDLYDSLSESGSIGGSAGNSSGTSRTVRSFFGEVMFPFFTGFEATLAARYDKYSDYGTDTSPKVSLRYQPMDMLTLRASAGKGFRAPTLDIISLKPTFSAESIDNDQATCEFNGLVWNETDQVCSAQFQVSTTIIANPQLQSEQSDQYSAGFVIEPAKWFNASLDYYNIELDNEIAFISPSEILDRLASGDAIPAGLGVTRDNSPQGGGRITNVVAGFANEGTLETSGLDLSLGTAVDFGGAGRLKSDLRAVYVLDYKQGGGRDLTGDPGAPQIRGNILTQYAIWDISAAWTVNYIDSYAQTVVGGEQRGHVPSYTTHDLQFNYTHPWDGMITVGALNIFGVEPSNKSAAAGRDYNFSLYDQYGTQPYIKYTQRFR